MPTPSVPRTAFLRLIVRSANPVIRSYGKREYRIRDPFGYLWIPSQQVPE